jgi:hypothetical protein
LKRHGKLARKVRTTVGPENEQLRDVDVSRQWVREEMMGTMASRVSTDKDV